MVAFEHRERAEETGFRKEGRAQARLGRRARVHALRPTAVRKIFDDARRERACDAHGARYSSAFSPMAAATAAEAASTPITAVG